MSTIELRLRKSPLSVMCSATNDLGKTQYRVNIYRTDLGDTDTTWMSIETIAKFGIVFLFVSTLICITCLCARKHFASHLSPEIQSLVDFMKGNPKYINSELTLSEQAYLLPYNIKYEFPRNKIELGEQLGSGAFGIVLKAIATGILPNEDKTTVAVKMIKPFNDNEVSFNHICHMESKNGYLDVFITFFSCTGNSGIHH